MEVTTLVTIVTLYPQNMVVVVYCIMVAPPGLQAVVVMDHMFHLLIEGRSVM